MSLRTRQHGVVHVAWLLSLMLCLAALHAAAAGTVVSGTISGNDQGFLKGVSVRLEGSTTRDTVTDADGRFTFTDVAPGQYRFKAAAEGYLPVDQPMQVGTASVSVDLDMLKLPGVP